MRLKGLDGIRALCALLLLWGHMAQKDFVEWDIVSLPLPECVAYVFFIISGVLAGFRIEAISSTKSYYAKKARRILPLYYSYILIVILVFAFLGRIPEVLNARFLYYLFLMPCIPFVTSQGICPLVHLWFIGTLVLFYLVIPLFAKVKEDKRKKYALLIASIWFAIKLLARLLGKGAFYRFVGCTSFDVLFFGVWGGLAIKDGLSIPDISRVFLSILAWGLFLFSSLYGHFVPAPVRAEYIAVLSFIIILTQQRQNSFSLLENKVSRFLGNISYEIYVGHIIVIILLSKFYQRLGINAADWVIYLVTTTIVILFAFLLNKGISYISGLRQQGA